MPRQPDPRNGVEGWRGFMDAVTIMAWVPGEPRKRLPVAVVEKEVEKEVVKVEVVAMLAMAMMTS